MSYHWLSHLVASKGYTQTRNSNTAGTVVSVSYPIIISDVDISSMVNQVLYHLQMAILRCHMQGRPLMKRKKFG